MRLNLDDAVDDLAPPPPPCFSNRLEWVQYLKSAAAAQNNQGEPRLILLDARKQPAINWDFPFCADCTQVHSLAMTSAGRCNPDHLKECAP